MSSPSLFCAHFSRLRSADFATLSLTLRLCDFAEAGCCLTATLVTRLLVMFVGTRLFEDTALHCLLFEAAQGCFDALTGLNDHLCQKYLILSRFMPHGGTRTKTDCFPIVLWKQRLQGLTYFYYTSIVGIFSA